MPVFGEVDVTLYWGTLYDNINVPYSTDQIISDATKTRTYKAYYVWQTAYLTQIRLNVADYREMIGVQYARIQDNNNLYNPIIWYQVLTYNQISAGCVELGLYFDSLLTIPISSWVKCSGIMRRWSVATDTPYKYLNSPEPIDLIEPLELIWDIIEPVPTTSNVAVFGAPYDMTEAPEIITYTNPNGEQTNVYYPNLKGADTKRTVFFSGLLLNGQANTFFTDGMQYNIWNAGQQAYATYNKAIALGIDIVVNGYILPSDWVETDTSGGYIGIMRGKAQTYTPQAPLFRQGLKNAKAGAINTTLTLASCGSGDSVTVNNFQLATSAVDIFTDPYSTGGFRARFSKYLNDIAGMSGWIKSPSWQPLTITSGVGFGTASNTIANVMSADTLQLQLSQGNASISLRQSQAESRAVYDTVRNAMDTGFNAGAAALNGDIGGALSSIAGGVTAEMDTLFNFAQQYASLSLQAEQLQASMAHQMEMLRYTGNVGRMSPPSVKYAMARDISQLTYAYAVMTARPSANDAKRLDDFFTAYGYNVDGSLLTAPSQLKTRTKFTFIQADEVRVTQTTPEANILDEQTITNIKQRFAAGIRIWRVTPDYDYSKTNPIATN